MGDGDELWENRSLEPIIEVHADIFCLLSRFFRENRLFLLYGNHDMTKSKNDLPLFPGIVYHSGIILKNQMQGKDIYLTHGHQADFFNSVLWRTARFSVRYLWKPLEQFGVLDPTSAAKNYTRKNKVERTLSEWADMQGNLLITGHTHRPRLGGEASSYLNTGSCVHPGGITCIEINGTQINLAKWRLETKPDRTLYVARELLETRTLRSG